MHRTRDLSILLYVLACLLPALTARDYGGAASRTLWGYHCLFLGWHTLTTLPTLFPSWIANFVFFNALWTGRAGHNVRTFALALLAALLALSVPLTVWSLAQPWSLEPGYFLWLGSLLLYAWKSRTAGEVLWPPV